MIKFKFTWLKKGVLSSVSHMQDCELAMQWVESYLVGNCAPWCSQLNLLCTKKPVNFWIKMNHPQLNRSTQIWQLQPPHGPPPQNAAMKAPNWCAPIERIENDRLPRTTWAGLFFRFFLTKGMECYCATIKNVLLVFHIFTYLFLTYFFDISFMRNPAVLAICKCIQSKQSSSEILCIECPGQLDGLVHLRRSAKWSRPREKHTLRTCPTVEPGHGKETKFSVQFSTLRTRSSGAPSFTRDSPCALLFQIRTSAKH